MNVPQPDPQPLAASSGSAGIDAQFRSVLVVDNDPAMRRMLSHVLGSHGYEVRLAANGSEAIDAIHGDVPYFAITDWHMPILDGAEFCRAVRREKLPHYVYIIMLTGSRPNGLVEGLACGADDFVTKPVHPHELLARLHAGARILELERRLSLLARSDPLTGLLNRRTFFELAEKEWERSCRNGLPLSCVMIDVDCFKSVNDAHGHLAGDAVLKEIAARLKSHSRTNDSVCRYGGEEFCVLLPETDRNGAVHWAQRCRALVGEVPLVMQRATIPVTISLGVAQRDYETRSIEALLDMADQALLAAKAQERTASPRSTLSTRSTPSNKLFPDAGL